MSKNSGSVGIYGTGNGTGNPVHLPSPNLYPTCVLTNPNFRCRVFQVVQSGCKTIELEAYRLDKDHALTEEKLKSLTVRLRDPFRLSGVDSIVTQGSLRQDGPTTVPV